MRRIASIFGLAILTSVFLLSPAFGEKEDDKGKIDKVAKETMDKLFAKEPSAKKLYDKAYGYAVFDNLKVSVGISGGGGRGVAIKKSDGARTYMRMGTGGLNLGLGGQKYLVVFMFETKERYEDFVNKGWQADTSANAVAGTAGANAQATFKNGLAYYAMTEAGLMLQADISGTKYWRDKKLNAAA